MLFYTLSFILLLGPLVFVHELGHFLFAKLFNVRVDVFSMGFGPKIFKKTWGETEYCVSVIPLGGYVKLFGQDPTEKIEPALKERALNHQEAWKRFLVFIGGPLFNFLFAILIFALMMVIGESHLLPVVSRVVPGSVAEQVGFRSGDVVTAIDRTVVTKLSEVQKLIQDAPNQELRIRVKRQKESSSGSETTGVHGGVKEIRVKPKPVPGLSIYGEAIVIGEIPGFFYVERYSVAGISNPHSIAALAGFQTGDEIVRFNQMPVKSWEDLERKVEEAIREGSTEFQFGVIPRKQEYWTQEAQADFANKSSQEPQKIYRTQPKPLVELGLFSAELFVSSVLKGSPAEVAGLQAGDRLLAIGDKTLFSFQELKDEVQSLGEAKGSFDVHLERAGERIKKTVTPSVNMVNDPLGNETKRYMIGVLPLLIQVEPESFVERVLNPVTLTIESWARALDLSWKSIVSIKKLFLRQVSVGTLGGPILIGKLAGESMSRGLSSFLRAMALISISLAIFNLLPVPVLDGGHILLLGVEVIRGKPISLRQSELVQQVGLSLIMVLLMIVLFNDFSRVGLPAIKQMFN